jgi:hypothetical protein
VEQSTRCCRTRTSIDEHPERLSDDSIETYLRPLVGTEQRTIDLRRFLAAFDNRHTLAVEAGLKTLQRQR